MELKEPKKKSKNNIFICIVGFVVLAIIVLILILLLYKKDNKKELENSLSEMGKNFYENFYYEQIGSSTDERNNLLAKFTTIGIKIDLENLGRYNNGEFGKDIKEFVNNKTKKKCSRTNTKVIIYPKSPYGKTDYKIETELDCGFEEKKS